MKIVPLASLAVSIAASTSRESFQAKKISAAFLPELMRFRQAKEIDWHLQIPVNPEDAC